MAAIVGYEVNIGWDISFPTITDLSAKQFYFGVLDNTGNIVVNSTNGYNENIANVNLKRTDGSPRTFTFAMPAMVLPQPKASSTSLRLRWLTL